MQLGYLAQCLKGWLQDLSRSLSPRDLLGQSSLTTASVVAGHLDGDHLQRCGSLPHVWLHPSGSVQAGSPLWEPALFCC